MIGSLVLSVLLQAVAPSATPPAPPVLQTLTLGDDNRACTADAAWCVGLVQDAPRVEAGVETASAIRPVLRRRGENLPEAPKTDNLERESYQPWDGLVRLSDGGFLAGVEATLTLAPNSPGAMPIFDYVTTATAYPRGVNRNRDSLAMRRLTRRDLVAERDPECSYKRRFTYDPTTGVYQPDKPLPDCTAYTVP